MLPNTAASGTTTGVAAPAPPLPLPGVVTVMVFPFDERHAVRRGIALGQALASAVERGMDASKVYSTVPYDYAHPTSSLLVQRAVQENPAVMNPAIAGVIDPVKGTVDQARAMQIAQRTGMQALLLGSIEEYTYDKATNKVSMVATAQLLNAQTGEPLRTAGVTGSATGAAGTDETTIAQAAATDVAQPAAGEPLGTAAAAAAGDEARPQAAALAGRGGLAPSPHPRLDPGRSAAGHPRRRGEIERTRQGRTTPLGVVLPCHSSRRAIWRSRAARWRRVRRRLSRRAWRLAGGPAWREDASAASVQRPPVPAARGAAA